MLKRTSHDKPKNRIRDWKGLFHNETRTFKRQIFLGLLLLEATMTFTQLGFIGVGGNGEYLCYVMALLAPIAATALLLGKGAGALQGILAGAVLYAHAQFQPLDLIDRYFTSVLNSFVLYCCAGFLFGLFFAIALRNNPTGIRRKVYAALVCFQVTLFATLAFVVNSVIDVIVSLVVETAEVTSDSLLDDWFGILNALGALDMQLFLSFALALAFTLFTDYLVRRRAIIIADRISVRTLFGVQLFIVAFLVFLLLAATSFAISTVQTLAGEEGAMGDALQFIASQLSEREKLAASIVDSVEIENMSDDALDSAFGLEYTQSLVNSYNLNKYGTVIIAFDGVVEFSNNPAYPQERELNSLFVGRDAGVVESVIQTGKIHEIVYSTQSLQQQTSTDTVRFASSELGYMRAMSLEEGFYTIVVACPSSIVFAGREATVSWSAFLTFILLSIVYGLAYRMLGRNVIGPINRTNTSLERITEGNLNEVVTEDDSAEFASLSTGINKTVDTLKGWIVEAETRMERELNTAKAIQTSALPRVFPPFPEVDKFDIFASMDAAKEVGGDFFDFFLIDDHTLGFLIADVSGKGIPGALFMMAAKTELQNYLSTGMEPARAIASANSRLCANNDAGMFVTVWAATLDYNTGELTYVNAGHNFPLLRHGFNGEWEWLKKKCGLFLGTFETAKYRQETITLHPGDELLMYTDGVNEAFSANDEEYGNDRLEAFLVKNSNLHPREIVRSLRADVAHWAEGAEQSDDITILSLEFGVAPEVTGTATFTATLNNLDAATSLVSAELERRLCPLDVQHKVEIAIEELFVNVCRYAYADQSEPGDVQVSYAYGTNPSTITVELRDRGVPFDPIKRQDPTTPSSAQEMAIGGLGIFMVKKSMDMFTYMRDGDTNVVVFKKGW